MVKAIVLRNNGRKAVLKPLDGKGLTTTMYRGGESRRQFLEMFPPNGTVELLRWTVNEVAQAKCDLLAKQGGWRTLEEFEQLIRETIN